LTARTGRPVRAATIWRRAGLEDGLGTGGDGALCGQAGACPGRLRLKSRLA